MQKKYTGCAYNILSNNTFIINANFNNTEKNLRFHVLNLHCITDSTCHTLYIRMQLYTLIAI